MSNPRRDGPGAEAYRRKAKQLRHRTQKHNLPCAWCGQPFDWTLPPTHRMAFTADHQEAIANGGKLLGQLQPMHRFCNSSKGKTQLPKIRDAS